jgi:2-polyprenyl-3-methyl-5-hydroxy-6-metoxy-1,4-benzoquinol methylase
LRGNTNRHIVTKQSLILSGDRYMKNGSISGGYEDGYASCDCFWGKSPGSLVEKFIGDHPNLDGMRVLDLGCGEGKNSVAFAKAGASVIAVDCSSRAIANGRRSFLDQKIEWHLSDAHSYLTDCESFDIIVMYGLLHCLPSPEHIESLVHLTLERTRPGGIISRSRLMTALTISLHIQISHQPFCRTEPISNNTRCKKSYSNPIRSFMKRIPTTKSLTFIVSRESLRGKRDDLPA